jgi:plasmid stabilization system protein ParE
MRRGLLDPRARRDLREAILYYNRQVEGLGRDFFAEVQSVLERVLDHPESAPELRPGVRLARVSRFHFDVIYRIKGDDLFVLAISHQSRSPDHWESRL